jgi:ketosteroid isomerase-like protein
MDDRASNADERLHIARAYFTTSAQLDWDGARSLMTDDFIVTNVLGQTFTGDEMIARDRWYLDHLRNPVAKDVKILVTDEGFVAEYVVSFIGVNGAEHTMRCCGVFGIRDGKVATYNRYVDRTGLAEATAGVPGGPW